MPHVLPQALEHDKGNDIMFWASSYNLFVTWAANGQHPWDNLPGSHAPSATLEIGALRGHSNKVTGTFTQPLLSSPYLPHSSHGHSP